MFDLLKHGVKSAEAFGAELAQARFDEQSIRTIMAENNTIRDVKTLRRSGIGITAFFGGSAGYSFTVDLTRNATAEAAGKALKIAKAASLSSQGKLKSIKAPQFKKSGMKLSAKLHPKDVSLELKKDLIMRAVHGAQDHGREIVSINAMYNELYGEKGFVDSNGNESSWFPLVIDIMIQVVSKREGLLADSMDWYGGSFGLEGFEAKDHTPDVIGANVGRWAAEKLGAKPAPAGKHRALCENMLAGVLAHESFGHWTEADFITSGMSALAGKLGERLGSEHATVIDEGTPQQLGKNGFWIPVDDQGVETRKVVIMDKGIMKGYLHSQETASLMGSDLTGNARAVDYNYPPIVRMRNTYFAPGDLTLEEALELLKDGVYAIGTSGGQASDEGTFAFNAARGYRIEKGEIKYPLREVTLSGSILSFLQKIEGATKELLMWSSYFAGCGKFGQNHLPVGVGGPHLLLSEAQFGGA
ncbi:MAG: TldD/PmbA family protein [Promethearchaeati archaeon SRVP18_Atabeyarchaeia-1]